MRLHKIWHVVILRQFKVTDFLSSIYVCYKNPAVLLAVRSVLGQNLYTQLPTFIQS